MFSSCSLTLYTLLFVGEQFLRDPIVVVGSKQFALLIDKLVDGLDHSTPSGRTRLIQRGNMAKHRLADALLLRRAEFDLPIFLLDRLFNRFDSAVGLRTTIALAAGADEVLVDATVATRAGVCQSTAASSAQNGAAQVVVVTPTPLARLALAVECILNLLEGDWVSESRMPTFADFARVPNDADVVIAAENLGEAVDADRLWLPIARRSVAQSTPFEPLGEFRQGVAPGRVRRKRQRD